MPDFTSALYLGLAHPSRSLPPWARLTLGRPAVLTEPPGVAAVAAELAALQGTGRTLLLPSTLHLFLDLFSILGPAAGLICVDAGAYPIGRRGAVAAAGPGVVVRSFAHHDPAALGRLLGRTAGRTGARPLVLADGFCPRCGRPAPLADYLALARRHGGLLVIDDTQALGVLGLGPSPAMPYGHGGGGVARHLGLAGPDLLIGASLAKGFGVPVAALSGAPALIERIAAGSASRLHCSPPSAAVIAAAGRALALNRRYGDALRSRLLSRVRRLRTGLGRLGLVADGGAFPVQTLRSVPGLTAEVLYRKLRRQDVQVLVLHHQADNEPRLGLLVTAAHGHADIEACLGALATALAGPLAQRAVFGWGERPPGGAPCPQT